MEGLISAVILFAAMIVICRGVLMHSFQPTRTSPSRAIQVDDNLHLFIVKNAGISEVTFAHEIADI